MKYTRQSSCQYDNCFVIYDLRMFINKASDFLFSCLNSLYVLFMVSKIQSSKSESKPSSDICLYIVSVLCYTYVCYFSAMNYKHCYGHTLWL